MRTFNYAWLRDRKWDTDLLGLIAAIYKEAGKQELFFKRKSKHAEKRNTKIKNGNGVDSEPLALWCDLLKSCTGVWSLNNTTALLPVNSVTLCVKFI